MTVNGFDLMITDRIHYGSQLLIGISDLLVQVKPIAVNPDQMDLRLKWGNQLFQALTIGCNIGCS